MGKQPCSRLPTLEWSLAVRPGHAGVFRDRFSQDFRGLGTARVLEFCPCSPSCPAGSMDPRDRVGKRGPGRTGTHPALELHSSDWRSRESGWLRSARDRAPRMLEDRIRDGLTSQIGLRAPSAGGRPSSGQSASSLSFQLTLLPQHRPSALPQPLHSVMDVKAARRVPGGGVTTVEVWCDDWFIYTE